MLRSFGRHVRQQFVGYLALFIALGGVSYAAITLPINSVGSKQIKRGAVKNSDLGRSAVTTGKVKNGSLLSIDFKPGQLVAGAPGATGPKGDKGDPGTNGTNGTNGATSVTVRESTCASNPCQNARAQCLTGEKATGGGGYARGNQYLYLSRPFPTSGTPTGWEVSGASPTVTTATGQVTVYAICAAP